MLLIKSINNCFGQLTIRNKILLFGAISVFILISTGSFSIYSIELLKQNHQHVSNELLPIIQSADSVNNVINHIRIKQYKYLILTSSKERALVIQKEIPELEKKQNYYFFIYTSLIKSKQEKKDAQDFLLFYKKYNEIWKQVVDLEDKGELEAAKTLMKTSGLQSFRKAESILETISQRHLEKSITTRKIESEYSHFAFSVIILSEMVAIVLTIFLGLYLSFLISHPIQKLTHLARKISNGEAVETMLTISSPDEVGILSDAFQTMLSNIATKTRSLEELNIRLEKALEERKRLETQLIQAQKMESIGQLAAGVAHEINNPVGFVMSNLGTLATYTQIFNQLFTAYQQLTENLRKQPHSPDISKKLSDIETLIQEEDLPFILNDVKSLLQESKDGTFRVQEIVKNLKSFARLDESSYKEANIHDGLESTLKVIWNELKDKCTVIKSYGDIPNIYCNPGQLNQVFMNLLINAAQAIQEKGEITITTVSTQKSIIITMSDNGSGISPETLDKIFDPFFTTKPVGKGTGLGLAISHGIIHEHHGSIEVESTVGKGTCFTIQLPLQVDST